MYSEINVRYERGVKVRKIFGYGVFANPRIHKNTFFDVNRRNDAWCCPAVGWRGAWFLISRTLSDKKGRKSRKIVFRRQWKIFLSFVGFSDGYKNFDLLPSWLYSLTNKSDFLANQGCFYTKTAVLCPSDFQKQDIIFFTSHRIFRRRNLVSYC